MIARQATVITIGCLVGAVLGVLAGVAQVASFSGIGRRVAVMVLSQFVAPELVVLVLVAAVGSRLSGRPALARATTAVALALALLALSGVAVVLGWWEEPVTAVQRASYTAYELADMLLACLAAWIAVGAWHSAQPVADMPGEAPDGSFGRGELVGEVELDGLFRT